MPKEDRTKYFTTKERRIRINARELIEDEFERIEVSGEVYEDFEMYATDSLSDEHIAELQSVLDKITEDPAFVVYEQDEQINPESEM